MGKPAGHANRADQRDAGRKGQQDGDVSRTRSKRTAAFCPWLMFHVSVIPEIA